MAFPPGASGEMPGEMPGAPYGSPPGLDCGGCGECADCDAHFDERCGFGRYGHGRRGRHVIGGATNQGWRLRVEAVLMDLKETAEPEQTSTIAGMTQMGIGNLDFDYELSPCFTLERRVGEDNGIEFVLFGFQHWNDSAVLTNAGGNINSPYQTLTSTNVPAYDGANSHAIAYSSELFNLEFNYWSPIFSCQYFQASCMWGFRYIRIEEHFDYSANDGTNLGFTAIEATNNMGGGQFGIMLWAPINHRVSVRFDGKSGIFYNLAQQETTINVINGPLANRVNYRENPKSSLGAFAAELSIEIVTQITDNASLYFGYQVMWIDQLVLAPENFSTIFPSGGTRPVVIDDTGRRLYHGAMGGVELIW